MYKKSITIVFFVAATGVLLIACQNKIPSQIATDKGIYCSPNGTFTDKIPIQSNRSYCIKSDANGKGYSAHSPAQYVFAIIDDQGKTLKNFEITHTKRMHLMVIRKDLKYFQHVHPQFNEATGQFTLTDLNFPADGEYRIFADFVPSNGPIDIMNKPLGVTIWQDVKVGTNYIPEILGAEERAKTFDGYQVTLLPNQSLTADREIMLTFDLMKDNKPVTDLQEYLGAMGHSIVLREETLDFIHAHPVEKINKTQNGKVSFVLHFPMNGKYKVFAQFQREEKVFITAFVVSVEKDKNQLNEAENTAMPTNH